MARPRRRRTARRARRAVEWFDTALNQTLAPASKISLDLSSQIATDEKKGMTVVRVIVDLVGVLSVSGTGGLVSMGLAMISLDNAGSLPEPNDPDQEIDWAWKTMNRTVANDSVNDQSQWTIFRYDSTVGRRFRFKEAQFRWIAEEHGGSLDNITINGQIRLLVAKS